MATLLPPIDKPKGIAMRVVFAMSRRQFGTVITSLKVFVPRMPLAFGSFIGKVSRLDKKLVLDKKTAVILREQVATINGCLFCMDAARYFALKEAVGDPARFDALAEYQTSPHFTDAERAALDYVSELTRTKSVSETTFSRLKTFYSEREICDIVWLVASEHLYNMVNLALDIGSDNLCDLSSTKTP